jgi:endonuclease/exonuclease/phosphatase (EEP) superfamily protein YafD
VAWVAVVIVGLVVSTQAVGWQGTRLVAATHALTPHLVATMVPVAAYALWRSKPPLGITGAAVGLAGLSLAVPIVFPPKQPEPVPGSIGLDVMAVNLLYENRRIDDAADEVFGLDADVIVFSEYTPDHRAALVARPEADRYPHRAEREGRRAGGAAIWSRFPISDFERPRTSNFSIDLVVDGPDGPVRVVGVHAPTPLSDLDGWKRDLYRFGRLARRPGPPTLVIGDFNASYWHPGFRDLLDDGLSDAHLALGEGWSASWPADGVVPPFVRLDHALTTDDLVATAVDDFDVPGSDHTGFVVTVAPAR